MHEREPNAVEKIGINPQRANREGESLQGVKHGVEIRKQRWLGTHGAHRAQGAQRAWRMGEMWWRFGNTQPNTRTTSCRSRVP